MKTRHRDKSNKKPATERFMGKSRDQRNQCQGCQAGWTTENHNPWPKGSKPMVFHIVVGGYKGEKVLCTKDRYKDS